MDRDSLFGNPQPFGHLAIGEALGDAPENVHLAWRQRLRIRRLRNRMRPGIAAVEPPRTIVRAIVDEIGERPANGPPSGSLYAGLQAMVPFYQRYLSHSPCHLIGGNKTAERTSGLSPRPPKMVNSSD
jgi:hypothetical protein